MHTLALLGSLLISAYASETYPPVFDEWADKQLRSRDGAAVELGEIRVQIFPHIGRYTSPQGRETVLKQVSLQSQGACVKVTRGRETRIRAGQVLTFSYEQLAKPVELICDGLTNVIREAGLTSYSYEGSFVVSRGKTSQGTTYVQVVNVLPFESYLKGVVPSEMPAYWPEESLKVQAVAARSYGYFQVMYTRENHPERSFDVDDTVQYQAYRGKLNTPVSDRAIEATANEVMTYEGKVIQAFFSADSGGHTEDAENEWPNAVAPYCRGRKEVYDLNLVPSAWSKSIALADLNRKLVAVGAVTSSNPVTAILLQDHFASGRVSQVSLRLKDGSVQRVLGTKFQYWVGLKSTLFSVAASANTVVLSGTGWGHGVGMNQWGAKALVESLSWDYRRILDFYYTGIVISGVDSEALIL